MELIFSKRFKKQAQKMVQNKPALKHKLNDCLIDFAKKNRKSLYYQKKLKGNWYGYEELQIGGDIRILIRIRYDDTQAVLEYIGSHSQLNL
jgi:mRNA-degrading endonuclease YafQ of YafQ-DinJ toxin-antitoxin module